jgi:hypothetical protein
MPRYCASSGRTLGGSNEVRLDIFMIPQILGTPCSSPEAAVDRYALRIGIAFLLYLGTCWGGPLPSIAVGTCKLNLQSYSTIQDAVINVAAGGTILVCAGAYPEQVLITKPLTMRGVLSGKAAASIITSPKGGLQQSTIDHLGNIWAAQVLVQITAGPVDISDLSVDGANNGISGSCPGLNVVGIYCQESIGCRRLSGYAEPDDPLFP